MVLWMRVVLIILDDVKNYLNDIALADLLPLYNPEIMGNFYRYDGSLTTPTCNEVVNWYVFGTPLYVSREQVLQMSFHSVSF